MSSLRFVTALAVALCAAACTEPARPDRPDAGEPFLPDGGFFCGTAEAQACVGNVHHSCAPEGEFLSVVTDDCAARGLVCVPDLWCAVCRPRSGGCDADGNATRCLEDGSGWEVVDECDLDAGEVCQAGSCTNLCADAIAGRSYLGCDFFAADLDNAALGAGRDASAQQYAIVVSNPSVYATDVTIEIDVGEFGGETITEVIDSVRVLPGDLEVFTLPRREVDGASLFGPCSTDAMCQSASQQCFCRGGLRPSDDGAADCRCRSSELGNGVNDGTHSALTAHAYRIRSQLPIIAYQFNPLDNVGVFSNEASLLLPTSGISSRYMVVGWPQTIAHSTLPAEDFDTSRDDEDLRAFLTIIGTEANTEVTITLGPLVRNVVGLPGDSNYGPGDVIRRTIGAFDVINLETQGFNADFTGTTVDGGGRSVSVFVGSEASDAPMFDDLANRRCCADHLEEQLFPSDTLGRTFYIGRGPRRSRALNAAFLGSDSVGDFNEPEYVRVVAAEPGITSITTTLPSPDDFVEIEQGQSVTFTATQDFHMTASSSVAVLQVSASQEAVGIPSDYPGGDPSIFAVPPLEQWRNEYVFLTPNLYAFDFVTIVAPADAQILLDERELSTFACDVGPADGIERRPEDPPPTFVSYRCQLSFPDVLGRPNVRVEDGVQNDGYHTLRASAPVSVVISGFDAFVSYAYVGGADLQRLR